jgi:hypothetical protein
MFTAHASRTLVPAALVAALLACGSPGSTATASPAGSAIPTSNPSTMPITRIEMARSVAKDGSAGSPITSFDAASDQRVIAVLTLANLDAGTKISYTRYIDNKYVNSKSASLKKRSKYFHFIFKPKAGATFTPGNYRMKFYVNEKAAGETTFTVK